MPKKLPPELLLIDLRKVAGLLGHTPFTYEYDELGSYTVTTLRKYFGSWKEACLAAGLQPTKGRGGQNRKPDQFYLSKLKTLQSKLGRVPLTSDYKKEYGHPVVIFRRWLNWKDALAAAGIDIKGYETLIRGRSTSNTQTVSVSDAELLSDLERVALELNHTPTCQEYSEHGQYSFHTFFKRFGSWKVSCEKVGLTPHTTHEGGPHRVPNYDYKRLHDSKTIQLSGSYELRFAKYLDSQEYYWLCHGEFPALAYTLEGKEHHYMPDFFVPSLETYYETKGWFRKRDKLKIKIVRQQLKVNIIVVTREVLDLFGC